MWTDEYRKELTGLLGMWNFTEDEKRFWIRNLTTYAPDRVMEALRAQYNEEEFHRKPLMRAIRTRLKDAGASRRDSGEQTRRRWGQFGEVRRRVDVGDHELEFLPDGALVGPAGFGLRDRPAYRRFEDFKPEEREHLIHLAVLTGGEPVPAPRRGFQKIPPEEIELFRGRGADVPAGEWTYAGLAARMASGIGKKIPSKAEEAKRLEEAKRELARRMEARTAEGPPPPTRRGAEEEGPTWESVDDPECPF